MWQNNENRPAARYLETTAACFIVAQGCNVVSSSLSDSPSSGGSEEVVILASYENGAVELCVGVLCCESVARQVEVSKFLALITGVRQEHNSAVAYLT
jgi:hypothetical protein